MPEGRAERAVEARVQSIDSAEHCATLEGVVADRSTSSRSLRSGRRPAAPVRADSRPAGGASRFVASFDDTNR